MGYATWCRGPTHGGPRRKDAFLSRSRAVVDFGSGFGDYLSPLRVPAMAYPPSPPSAPEPAAPMGYPPPSYSPGAYAPPAAAPPGFYPPRGPNWWMLSGLMVALGALCVGIGFVILGLGAVATTYSPNYAGAFYAMVGVGVIFLGLSWLFARMTPRMR